MGQTKFEFEIDHRDHYVNQALVLQKSPLHLSLEKYIRCTPKRQRQLRNLYVVTTLFLRNLRLTYVLITLLYSYVKTPYLTQQTFTCSKSTIETLEKGLIYVLS